MTINREKLIKLLVERTRMTKAEVGSHLDELSNRIMDAADRGKALEIKDFGLFYFDDNDDLSFKASDQLNTEINFEYAGMEPVELKPPQAKSASDSEKSEIGQQKVTSEPETPSEPDPEEDFFGIKEALTDDTENIQAEEEEEFDPESFAKIFEESTEAIEPKKEEEVHKAGTAAHTRKKKKAPVKKRKHKKKERQKKSRGPVANTILVLSGVIILILTFILTNEYVNTPEPSVAETDQPAEIEEPPATAQTDITETETVEPAVGDKVQEDTPADTEQESNETDEPTDNLADEVNSSEQTESIAAEDEVKQGRYGLYGDYIEADGTEYTIVVHSFRTQELAQNVVPELIEEGYRTTVTERTVNNNNVFRVGIGQFDSVDAALREAESLPEPYRNQNFIKRIQ